jgi:hypothetical protein
VAVVEHPDVAELPAGAAPCGRGAVAVDPMAIQVEGDVLGADHDSVVRAVDEVAVERRVRNDRVSTAHVIR